jgi:transposase
MKEKLRFLGLDVHAETIAVAIAEPDGEVRSLGTIPNRADSLRKLIKKLGPAEKLRVCYEAGPTGYVVYWQLAELGVKCDVVAPTLVPVKAGDRVKTDRRDAEKLARSQGRSPTAPPGDFIKSLEVTLAACTTRWHSAKELTLVNRYVWMRPPQIESSRSDDI